MSRFEARGIPSEEIWEEPRVYAFDADLAPGATLVVANGPVTLDLLGEEEPYARWDGPVAATKERVQFHYGSTVLQVTIPADWVAITGHRYAVRLMSGLLGRPVDLEIQLNDDGTAVLPISEIAAVHGWKPGVARVQIEVRRPDEARVILRGTALCWFGLSRLTSALRFECEQLPSNLLLPLCQNVTAIAAVLKPSESLQRVMRLVFDLGDGRQQSLTWNRPGIFIEVESFDDSGRASRTARPIGGTESVSHISSKQIIISSSDPGTLRLGDWAQHFDFSRFSSKLLSAPFLASRIAPNSSALTFQADQAHAAHTLLKLRQPRNVDTIVTRMQDGQFLISLGLNDELEAINIEGKELTSGQSFAFTISADEAEWTAFAFGRSRLITQRRMSGGFLALIYIAPDQLPRGAWILSFDGCVRQMWGHLENTRQDRFAASLLWSGSGGLQNARDYVSSLTELDDHASLAALDHINSAMQLCYAQDAWGELRWLDQGWQQLVGRWRGREDVGLAPLVDIATARPSDDLASSWLPMRSLAASLPGLFSLPCTSYARVNDRPHGISRTLRAIHAVREAYPIIFPDLLHFAVAAGFSNMAAIQRGAVPQGFDMGRFGAALEGCDASANRFLLEDEAYQPEAGDLLGPLHFRFAIRALDQTYARTLSGNEIRRGQAIGLSRDIWRSLPRIKVTVGGNGLNGQRLHITPWWLSSVAEGDEGEAQHHDNLKMVCHLLSWFAFSCRADSRRPGALAEFLALVREGRDNPDSSLSYLLQVGESVFLFYLLAWEVVLLSEFVKDRK